jgi:hypothetical protein
MIAIAQPSLLADWRRQVGRPSRRTALPRPLAALGFLTSGAVVDGLVEIENVVLVALYDELHDDGRLSLTLAGYSGARVPWGVQWGGPSQNLFRKDLFLRPRPQAYGRCLDSSRSRLLHLALELDRSLTDTVRRPRSVGGRQWVLPRLWAGFRPSRLADISADGPELAAAAERSGKTPTELLVAARRTYQGLALLPLEWTSHHWLQMAAVFADLGEFPEQQVVPLRELPRDLQGFQDAAAFDFHGSRFRPVRSGHPVAPPVCELNAI